MKLFSKTKKARFVPQSKRLLAAMMVVTIIVAAVIGIALCQTALSLLHDMESTLVQKNVQIIGQNMSRTMESVDEFALGIVTSEPVQMFCKSQTEGASKEYNTAMLSLSLERQVQRSHNDYRFNANFLNIYAKNGISEIQFENLPYSDYESCIRYYEDMEIISNDRYTPMTWVDCVKLKDASGKSVNSLIWIRFLYDSVTMEKLVLWCAEEKSTQLETVMNKLSDDVALCFQTQLKIGIGAMISDLSQISVSAKYAQHCLDLEDTSAQSPQKNHLVVLAKKYVKENLKNPNLGFDDVCDYIGITKIYFGRIFQKEEGVSFGTYINQCRVELAKEILDGTNLRVSEVADAVGFSNTKYFSVVFKSLTGMTPLDYRRSMRFHKESI